MLFTGFFGAVRKFQIFHLRNSSRYVGLLGAAIMVSATYIFS